MESPGRYLKTERESRNLSLRDVFKSTRINERLLKAIEEDKYELLSSPVYVKGFLDTYARYLGLDPNDISLRYQKYLANKTLSDGTETEDRVISKKKRIHLWFSVVFIAAILFLLGISIYYFSLKPGNYSLPFYEKKESEPTPSIPSSPPIQKEGEKDE
jgi:cytoskeleton protein RodZ